MRIFNRSAHLMAAMADQVVLSLANLSVGLCLLLYAEKVQYGLYAQLFAVYLLGAGVLNALFVSPFLTLAPARDRAAVDSLYRQLLIGQVCLSLVAAIPILVFGVFVGDMGVAGTAGCVVVAVLSFGLRELLRARLIVLSRPLLQLALSLVFLLSLTVVLFGSAWFRTALDSSGSLLALGLCGLAVVFGTFARVRRGVLGRDTTQALAGFLQCWAHGKWALVTTLITWAGANSFAFTAAAFGNGLESTADVSAARLLVMPLATLFPGLVSVVRPQVVVLTATGDWRSIDGAVRRFSWIVLALGGAYSLLCVVAMRAGIFELLPRDYLQIGDKVALWLAYFVLTGLSSVQVAALLGAGLFRANTMFVATAVCANLVVTVCVGPTYGSLAPMLGLIASEIVLLSLLLSIGGRLIRERLAYQGAGSRE